MRTKLSIIVLILIGAALLGACVPAVSSGVPNAGPRVISVTGTGQAYLTPNIATIYIGVSSRSENVADALKENNAKAQAVAAALTALGVEAKDIQTSSFNVMPQQQYGPTGEMLGVIYVVENTVNVTARDLTKLGEMLNTVVTSGANSINNIQFDVVDKQAALTEARTRAVENARKQAEDAAKAAGFTLGDVYSMSIYTSGGPIPLYEGKGGMAAADGSVPVAAGQLVISVDVNISYEIK